MYDRAADYRRAVDEHLFGLGAQRYEALVNLLIQLRQPQLSKKPDEKLLSRALTEALPPLSPGLVTTVAEAFRGLDEERDALRSLAEAQEAATAFLGHYRRYAKVAAKRKAAGPRLTQSRYEQLGRDLAAAEEAFTAAQRQLDEAQGELDATGGTAHRAGRAPESAAGRSRDARRRAARAAPRGRGPQGEGGTGPRDRPGPAGRPGQAVRRQGGPNRAPGRHRTGQARPGAARGRDTAADARCAQQHQAAVAALDGPGARNAGLEARAWALPCRPNGPTASTARSLPTWMPPRRPRPTFSPGPGATPRPSPTGRRRPSRSWPAARRVRRHANGSCKPRKKRKAGCRLRSRPRRTGSRPRTRQ